MNVVCGRPWKTLLPLTRRNYFVLAFISLMDLSLKPMSGLKPCLDLGGGGGMDFLLNGHISFQLQRRQFLRSNIHEQFNKQAVTTQWSKRKASDEDDALSVIHTIVINTQMNSTGNQSSHFISRLVFQTPPICTFVLKPTNTPMPLPSNS
jgi:hypothetical protein